MAEQPEPSDAQEETGWLHRLWQRSQKNSPGDTIAAQIGEGATNVVVGKNIIQIGSLRIPRWLALTLLAVVSVGLVVGVLNYLNSRRTAENTQGALAILQATATPTATPTITPTPLPTSTPTVTPQPVRMNGDLNLVVAPFAVQDAQGSLTASPLGHELSLWLARRLNRELNSEEVRANLGDVVIWHQDLNRPPANSPIAIVRTEADAARLVQDLNAMMVISGVLSGPVEAPTLRLAFYYGIQRVRDQPDSALGQHLFGNPVAIAFAEDPQLAVEKQESNPELTQRATALVWLIKALTREAVGEPTQALGIFQEAERNLATWDNATAKTVFYYFMGRTALLINDLDEAQRTFELAVDGNPQNIPAQIGLGNFHYTRAQLYFVRQQPLTDTVAACTAAFANTQLDLNAIAASAGEVPADFAQMLDALHTAQTQYELALDLATRADTPTSYLAELAGVMIASVHCSAGEGYIFQYDDQNAAGAPDTALLEQASAQLAQANDLYEQTLDPFQQTKRFGMLSFAYLGLGLTQRAQGYIDQQQGVADRARTAYEQALDYLHMCTSLKDQPDGNGNRDLQEKMSCFCTAYEEGVQHEYIQLGGGEG